MTEIDYLMNEHLRRMAEPQDLRELRQQAERIENDRRRATERALHEMTKRDLRQQIRAAGEVPCR